MFSATTNSSTWLDSSLSSHQPNSEHQEIPGLDLSSFLTKAIASSRSGGTSTVSGSMEENSPIPAAARISSPTPLSTSRITLLPEPEESPQLDPRPELAKIQPPAPTDTSMDALKQTITELPRRKTLLKIALPVNESWRGNESWRQTDPEPTPAQNRDRIRPADANRTPLLGPVPTSTESATSSESSTHQNLAPLLPTPTLPPTQTLKPAGGRPRSLLSDTFWTRTGNKGFQKKKYHKSFVNKKFVARPPLKQNVKKKQNPTAQTNEAEKVKKINLKQKDEKSTAETSEREKDRESEKLKKINPAVENPDLEPKMHTVDDPESGDEGNEEKVKQLEFKIDEALKLDSGVLSEDEVSDENSPKSDAPSETPISEKLEWKAEDENKKESDVPVEPSERPILEKLESIGEEEAEEIEPVGKPSKSRPGLIFKGYKRMAVRIKKYRLKDISRYFGKKRIRRILVNQPYVKLVRMQREEAEKYLQLLKEQMEKNWKSWKKLEKRKREVVDEEPVLKKIKDDSGQPKLLYIDRLLQRTLKDSGKKSKFQALLEKRKGKILSEIPEDPKVDKSKPKKQIPAHLKLVSPWQTMPTFKIGPKTKKIKQEPPPKIRAKVEKKEPVPEISKSWEDLAEVTEKLKESVKKWSQEEKVRNEIVERKTGDIKSVERWKRDESWRKREDRDERYRKTEDDRRREGSRDPDRLFWRKREGSRSPDDRRSRDYDERRYRGRSRDRDRDDDKRSRDYDERRRWDRSRSRDRRRDDDNRYYRRSRPSRWDEDDRRRSRSRDRSRDRSRGRSRDRDERWRRSPSPNERFKFSRSPPRAPSLTVIRPSEVNRFAPSPPKQEPEPQLYRPPRKSLLAAPTRNPRSALLNRPDEYVSPLERRAPVRRPQETYKKAFWPKVENKNGIQATEDPNRVSSPAGEPDEGEESTSTAVPVQRRRGGLLDESATPSGTPKEVDDAMLPQGPNADLTAFVESLSDEEEQETKEEKDEYDLAADYLMASSQDFEDIRTLQQAQSHREPVESIQDPELQEHEALVKTALQLIDRYGLSVDDILNQSQRTKEIIAQLEKEDAGGKGPGLGLLSLAAGEQQVGGASSSKSVLEQPEQRRRSPSPMDLDESFNLADSNFGKSSLLDLPAARKSLLEDPDPGAFESASPDLSGIPRPSLLGPPPSAESAPFTEGHMGRKPLLSQNTVDFPSSTRPVLMGDPPPNLGPNRKTLIPGGPTSDLYDPSTPTEVDLGPSSSTAMGRLPLIQNTDVRVERSMETLASGSASEAVHGHFKNLNSGFRQSFARQQEIGAKPRQAEAESALPYGPDQLLSIIQLLLEDRSSSLHANPSKMQKALQLVPELKRMVAMGPSSLNEATLTAIIQFVLDIVNSTVSAR